MSAQEKGQAYRADTLDPVNDKDFRESDMIEAAIATGEEETRLGLRGLFKIHGKAAMWSMLLSLALVMEGMDVGLVSRRVLLRSGKMPQSDPKGEQLLRSTSLH